MTDTAIEVDEFLPHPPAKVWRALTDPVRLARWLMANDFEPVLGHKFTFRTEPVPSQGFDGIIDCSVLEIEPERLLKISWGRVGLDTTVTWRLHPEGTGTRLFLEHAGFAPDDPGQQRVRMILDGGWRSNLWRRLTAELSREP